VSDIFRDPTEGAMARRLDLLRRRRDELITMPHAVRRVVVARSARIAASLVLCVGGTAMLAAAASPVVSRVLEGVLPGQDPAVLSQLLLGTWVLAVFAYAMTRSRAEHRFVVAMSRYVLPGDDLAHDIERLSHEHPDAMAKQMAQRLEVRSAALPVLAAALVLPATALYVIDSVSGLGWSRTFDASVARQGWGVVGCAALGVVAGIAVTRRFARVPIVATIAGCTALLAATGVAIEVVLTGGVPPIWRLAPLVLAATIALVVRRLRIEREWIDADDPAAGSKLFTLRDAADAVRRAYGFIRPRVRRSTAVIAAAGAALVAVAATTTGTLELSPRVPIASAAQAAPSAPLPAPRLQEWSASPDVGPRYRVESVGEGQVRMTVELENGGTVEIPGIAGLETVPAGWYARILVRLADAAPGPMRVTPFVGEVRTNSLTQANAVISTIEVCGPHQGQLGLHVGAPGSWPEGRHAVSLIIEPYLSLSPCPGAPRP
jgi:hypothetical protein